MKVGIPKELKNNENRIAITPAGVMSLVGAGHSVKVEKSAGEGSGISDQEFEAAGAVLTDAASVWNDSDLVLKVKEPLPSEYGYFRSDLVLFAYLHLAAEPQLADAILSSGMTAVAYETVEINRSLPLLTPMSEIAGRMAAQIGAQILEKPNGGKGILLGGVPGVRRGKVTIIGGGAVGTNAAKIAVGLGAEVTVIDLSPDRLRQLDDLFGNQITTLMSNPLNIAESVAASDLVIGAVLIPGAKAPKLVSTEMVQSMKPGSVIIDVAVDQGGIFETVDRITTHDEPTYKKFGVVHYAVANMPGAVPMTSTYALTNASLPYVLEIANRGLKEALLFNKALQLGVNAHRGSITHPAVARALSRQLKPIEEALLV